MCTYQRQPQLSRAVPGATAGPGVTVGHRLAGPNTPGAASGPLGAPNGAYLAPVRSHLHAERICRPRGDLAAAAAVAGPAACAPRTPPTLLAAARPAPAAAPTARRPLRPLQAALWPKGPARSAHCGGAATALWPAPTRQTGRDESWATRTRGAGVAAAAAAASSNVTAVHAATRTHTCSVFRVLLTWRNRPRRAAERSAVAAVAAAMTPRAWAIGRRPSEGVAMRVEVPASAE